MTRKAIAHQLEVIRQGTLKATGSAKAAADFLKRAGLEELPKQQAAAVKSRGSATSLAVLVADLRSGTAIKKRRYAATGKTVKKSGAYRSTVKTGKKAK